MKFKIMLQTVLIVISMSCVANADMFQGFPAGFGGGGLIPGHGGPGWGGPGHGGPGWGGPGHGGPGWGGPGHGGPGGPPFGPPHGPPPGYPYPHPQPPPYYPPQPPPPPPHYAQNIEINLFRSVQGNDSINLGQYFDLLRYRGLRIEQVLVTGTPRFNSGLVTLVINGLNYGQLQLNGVYSQRGQIWVSQQPMIGAGAESIVLYTSGDMNIEHVTLVVR